MGVNVSNPTKLQVVSLLNAHEQFFSVKVAGQTIHYPYNQIVCVTEGERLDFNETGEKVVLPMAIWVTHQIVYKGAIGIGMAI